MRILVIILLFSSKVFSQCPGTIDINLPLFDSTGTGITLHANGTATITGLSNFTLRGWRFTNNASGTNGGYGLRLVNCSNFTIDENFFDETFERALSITGTTSNGIVTDNLFANNNWGVVFEDADGGMRVENNEFLNMGGERSGQGCCRGQAIYFIRSYGTGNIVRNNRVVNFVGESYQGGDVIAIYESGGESTGRMLIEDNIVWGWGPGTNGVGIIIGDVDGKYVVCKDNRVLQGAITNIGVAGGHHISLHDNMVWGDYSVWSGGGYYAYPNLEACDSIKLDPDNLTWVIDKNGAKNDVWYGGGSNCTLCNCDGPANLSTSLANAYTTIISGMPTDSRGLPGSLITFLCVDDYWKVRNKDTYGSTIVSNGNLGAPAGSDPPQRVDLSRPTAAAGTDQSISISTATLTSSSTATAPQSPMTGTNTITLLWVQVSGPNTATMSASTSATNNLSGMISGTYIFRLVVTQALVYNNGLETGDISYNSWKADWVTVIVSTASDPPYPAGRKIPIKRL